MRSKAMAKWGVIGVCFSYFVLHPIAMIVGRLMLEPHLQHNNLISITPHRHPISEIIVSEIIHSFSYDMLTWALAFSFVGGLVFLLCGRIHEDKKIIRKAHRELDARVKEKTAELASANEFLNDVMSSLSHPFYVIDANDYTIKFANPAASQGHLSAPTTCYAMTHRNDTPCGDSECSCPLEKVKKNKKNIRVEHVHYKQDGTPRHVEVYAYPMFDSNGHVDQMIEYSLDITDRKLAENALKESKRQLSIRSQIAHTFLTTPDDEIYAEILQIVLEATASEYGVFGYIDQEGALVCPCITKQVWEQCQMSDKTVVFPQEVWGGIWGRALIEKKSLYSNKDLHVPKGHIPICRALVVPIIHKGKLVGGLLVANKALDYDDTDQDLLEDIAGHIAPILHARLQRDLQDKARICAEQALKKNEAKLLSIIEHTNEVFYIHDRNHELTYVSPKSLDVFGYTQEEMMRKWTDLTTENPMNEEGFRLTEEAIKTGERQKPYLLEVRRKDGNCILVEIDESPVKDANGSVVGISGALRDVTDKKKAEEEKRGLAKQLQQAQKLEAIGTLAGGIAHDFNNILGSITTNAEMGLDDVRDNAPTQRNLKRILKASKRAADLVRQILAFSRRVDQEWKPVEIAPIIKESIRLLRASLPATVKIRQDISAELATIVGDPTQIQQILINLCTNAAHAMGEKGGRLEITLGDVNFNTDSTMPDPQMGPGAYLRLAVSDTGSGMEDGIIERIFEPYFTTKSKGGGTGLGLATVHGIVKAHGGTITVNSKVGRGTTFQVSLPKCGIQPEGMKKENRPLPEGKERILFIDDEEDLVDAVPKMLERLGYNVVSNMSSIEALDVFRSQPDRFDLVITDQTMPQMTGIQLVEELRNIRQDIPSILCTGFSDNINVETAKDMGVGEFIMKPVERRKMAEAIRRVLNAQSETQSL